MNIEPHIRDARFPATPRLIDCLRDPLWWLDGLGFVLFLAALVALVVVLGTFTGAV